MALDEEVKKSLDAITAAIDDKVEKATKQAESNAEAKADTVIKGEIKNLEAKFVELHGRLDKAEVNAQKTLNGATPRDFKSALVNSIKDGAFDGMIKNGQRETSILVKAAGDMTEAVNLAGEVIPAQYVPGIKFDPTRPVHMRQLLPSGSTQSNSIRYIRESAYQDGVSTKSEGATLGQSDFTLTAYSTPIEKIGTYIRISDEMLDDTPQLISYLSACVPAKLLQVEDTQILSGNGTSPNLDGIIGNATAFAAGGFALGINNANQFDVLIVAINQLALVNYRPTYILMNPTDFAKILLLKSTTNEYLKDQVYMGLQPQFNGIPVVLNTAIPAGSYLMGDFSTGAQFWVRQDISLEFFREDGTNVRDGFVTVVVKERAAITAYSSLAFVTGVFATDMAALETA